MSFSDLFYWKKFSVIVKEDDVPHLKKILKGIPERKFEKMSQNVLKVDRSPRNIARKILLYVTFFEKEEEEVLQAHCQGARWCLLPESIRPRCMEVLCWHLYDGSFLFLFFWIAGSKAVLGLLNAVQLLHMPPLHLHLASYCVLPALLLITYIL